MNQNDKSAEQLSQEVAVLRQRNRALEAAQVRYQKMEQSLLSSEDRYRTLAEKSLQGISITRDGKRLFANPALANILGYASPDELISVDAWTNIAPHERGRLDIYRRKRLQGEPAPTYYVYQGVKKDGALIWLENTVSNITWNGKQATLKTLFDITKRIQAEKALRQMHAELEQRVVARTATLRITNQRLEQEIAQRSRSEAALRVSEIRWRSLVENAPATITELDASGTIAFSNRGWGGLSRDEVVGTHIDDHLPPAQRTVLHHAMTQSCVTREVQQYEIVLPAPEGTITCYAHRLTALAPQNLVTGFLLVSNDITDQKRVENLLRQQERLASIGTLAAGIAHEINNPLGAILLTAQHARRAHTQPQSDDVVQECLDEIVADIDRCSRIVKSVLQFARQESSAKWPTDLNRIVRAAYDITQPYCKEHGVGLQVEPDRDLPLSMVNPVEIEQVLVNFIRNAVEANSDRITIRTGTAGGAQVQIKIHDNGKGIADAHMPHIFDPFYSAPEDKGGTGLGLSITHGIISEHGGTIDLKSKPGLGTTVYVRLPQAPAASHFESPEFTSEA